MVSGICSAQSAIIPAGGGGRMMFAPLGCGGRDLLAVVAGVN
jgi:hypothetical protein